jgi:2-C-methyl-D-erythritol 4-phosphate cytidylyltransferase
MAASFSVVLITVPPAGLTPEGGGAFVKIDGKESLLRAVELFLNRDNVKQIQIAFTPEAMEEAKRKYAAHLSFSGVKVLSGGPKWMDQVAAAAGKIADEATHVVLHDAARPAVAYSDIDALLEAAEKHAAAVLAAPLRAPLVEVDEGGNALAFESANRFQQLLTPQVFSKAKFEEMAKSRKEPHASELTLVKGSGLNVRINSSGEVSLVKAMMNLLPKPKIKGPSNPFEEAQW